MRSTSSHPPARSGSHAAPVEAVPSRGRSHLPGLVECSSPWQGGPARGGGPRAPGLQAARPRPALTWPVMPVMRATFLSLPISPSPEPGYLGQLAGAWAMSLQAGERATDRKAEWNKPRAGRDEGACASRFKELQRPPRSDRARGRPGVERGAGQFSRGGRREPGCGLAGAASLALAATRQQRPRQPRPRRGLRA